MNPSGEAMWILRNDFESIPWYQKIGNLFSGVNALHSNRGVIQLNYKDLMLFSDSDEIIIPLNQMTEIFLGFDEVYKRSYVKNFGFSWAPLRITYDDNDLSNVIYLIIDYNFYKTSNQEWFELIKSRI